MLLNDMVNLQGLSQPAKPTYSFPSPQAANEAMGRADVRANNRMQRKIKSPYINDAHRRYEQAFDRGDLNSPAIIGVDPAQFGYGPDMKARPQRMQGLPQNFLGAPQLPTHDPELYDEVLRHGPISRGSAPAQDPLAILRSLLGF